MSTVKRIRRFEMKPLMGREAGISRIAILVVVILLVIIAAAVIYLWPKPPASEPDEPVRIVFKTNSQYLIYFVARDRGFFEEAGLRIEETEMESTNLMIQALAGGRADFHPSASVPALYSAEENSPGTFKFLYFMLMEKGTNNDAIIVRADAPFRSLAELAGHTVGAQPGATSLILLKVIFQKIGVDFEQQITVQEMEPRALLQALAAGQVDAVFALEPLITMGEEKGISRVLEAEPIERYVMNPTPIAGGVVTKRFVEARPEALGRLREAMERAIDFTRANESQARAIMASAIGMPEGTANRLGINTYWKLDEANATTVQSLADLLRTHGALRERVDTRAMYLDSGGR